MIKLAVFDFDSTLIESETIDELAKAAGADTSALTQKAMRGELSFYDALRERVLLLKGLDLKLALNTCSNLKPSEGAADLIAYFKARGTKVLVLSGGFSLALEALQKTLKYEAFFCNHLLHENDKLSGLCFGELMHESCKGILLRQIKNLLQIDEKEVCAIGDGANDLAMFKEAGVKIAYRAKPVLNEAADFCASDFSQIQNFIKGLK